MAWAQSEDDRILKSIAALRVSSLEISPFRESAGKSVINSQSARNLKKRLNSYGIKVVALQALLYRFPELVIFEDKTTRERTFKHLMLITNFAHEVGAKALIFGSPKNKLIGKLGYDNAFAIATDFFGRLAEKAKLRGISLCIEPTPAIYGADFLRNTDEVVALLKAVNVSALRLNLDIGALVENRENIESVIQNNIQRIGHVHISEPFLKRINLNLPFHKRIANALNANSYNDTISIEMLPQANNNIDNIYKTLSFVKKIYGNCK